MIASWQTIVLYFMIAGRPVFLVLLLHTISGPSTARTISAPLRRTSRCIQKLAASSPNEAQRSGFGLDKEERRNEGEMAFALKKKTPSRTICSTRRRGGGGWIRFSAEKPGGCGVPPAHRQEPPSLVLTSFVSLVPPYTPGLAHFAARPLPTKPTTSGLCGDSNKKNGNPASITVQTSEAFAR